MKKPVCIAAIGAMLLFGLGATNAVPSPQSNPSPASAQQNANASSNKQQSDNNVVGSVFGENLTWDDFVASFRRDFPQQFEQTIAQVAGPLVAEQLFGAEAKPSVTISQDQILAQLKQNPPPTLYSAVNAVLQMRMIVHQAQQEGITVSPADVDNALDQQFQQLRKNGVIPANLTNDQFLAQRHISMDQLRERERFNLLLQALIKKDIEKQLGHPIGPGDFVDARHILIKAPAPQPNASAATKKSDADAKAKAGDIRQQILAKKMTFEDAAKKFSDDPGSKSRGGDLGVFMRGQMVAPFDAAAFSLKPGQISQPVHTQFGYHLIEVVKTGDQIPPDQRQQVLDQFIQQKANEYISQLAEKANLKNNLPPPAPTGLPVPGR